MLDLYPQSTPSISKHSSYQAKTLLNLVSPTPMAPGRRPSLHGKVRLQPHNYPPALPSSQNDTDSQVQLVRAGGCWFCTAAAAAGGGAGQWQAGRPRLGAVQQRAGRQAEAVYTSSPLHPPPVNSDPAPAARGYKTHNCRKAQAAQVKAKILLKP